MTTQTFLRYLTVAALSAACVATNAIAQDSSIFERVLVPVLVNNVPGAFGTLWSTELWYRNNSTRGVMIVPLAVSDFVPTIGRTEILPIGNFPIYAPGQILFVSRDGGDEVQFDLRLFNRADPRSKWGTKIPVVREREFRNVVNLINVPTNKEFRSALRVYGLREDAPMGETVLVRIYSYDERLLASAEMRLDGVPWYASISSLADTFPEIRQTERVRVQIESPTGNVKLWAFVSVTSNTTQDVSLVTPD